MAKLWKDTRPGRPDGEYFIGGVRFEGGIGETNSISKGTATLFAALGVEELKPPTDQPADGEQTGDSINLEGVPLTDDEQAAVDAGDVDAPVIDAPEVKDPPARRSRGAK